MAGRILVCFIIFLGACAPTRKAGNLPKESALIPHGKIWSSVFQQRAAEYKALCDQAYNIARLRLEEALQKPSSKPLAIITDIDETILDNSPYAVQQGLQGKDYEPDSWYEWTEKGMADTLSGALSFFNYAASRNVEIFYITNREEQERKGTLKNLQAFHFPFADDKHLILKQTISSKEERREKVATDYNIILLIGDNLADFSNLFDKKTEEERNKNVQLLSSEFGRKFIILPNANYGGWEDAIYLNQRNWSTAQKDSLLKSKLR